MHQVEQRDNATVIHINGELDAASAPALAAIIKLAQSQGAQRIIVSLERCGYCYAAGLAVLALAQKNVGVNLFVVVPAKAHFRRVFEISGLAQVLQLVPTMQRALDGKGDLKLQPSSPSAVARKQTRPNLKLLTRSA